MLGLHRFSKFLLQDTFYMKKLPPKLISFSSEYGKQIFKDSLQDNTMECYFPLAEQFLTQYKPSTCGATSLVMVLNALKIDPLTKWQGIWRWYCEENLNGLKQEHLSQGINLSDLTHIAEHNRVAIQTFYHPNQIHIGEDVQKQKKNFNCLDECQKLENRLMFASFETFELCVQASSRRSGFYIIVNASRQALGQTGLGHFMPIGGYNKKENLAFLFDVARYKYPPQWVDIKLLYDSFAPLDVDTQMTRGFSLITRSLQYPKLCRISEDNRAKQKIATWYNLTPKADEQLPHEVSLQGLFYLFEFVERKTYLDLNLQEQLNKISIFTKEEVFDLVKKQRQLFALLTDFSFRDQGLFEFISLLIYNYFFSKRIKESNYSLRQEFTHMDNAFGLNLI